MEGPLRHCPSISPSREGVAGACNCQSFIFGGTGGAAHGVGALLALCRATCLRVWMINKL